MVRVYYFTGHYTISWPTAFLIIYGVLALITAIFALILAYHGEKPYKHVPKWFRNRRWVKPVFPMMFVILPALLWPLVMVSLGIFILGGFFFNKEDGMRKKMKGHRKEKDVEMDLGTDVRLNQQSILEHNPTVTKNLANATTISEPPPAYKSHGSSRRLLPEREIAW